jgi:hypothetical protein
MAMDADRRRRYQDRAGITDEQVRQSIGGFTVNLATTQDSGLADAFVEDVRAAVQGIVTDVTLISAAYNQLALDTDGDARDAANPDELAIDREMLEAAITPNFRLTDPAGNVGNREKTLEAILSGKIRKDTFGPGGFETLQEEFIVRGQTAVSVGIFRMHATQMAMSVSTGEERRRRRDGTFRSTHTYVYENDRWRLAASQLTQLPDDVVFVND